MEGTQYLPRLVASHAPDRPISQELQPADRTYFKSVQWSPDGTSILASTADNVLTTHILPPDLLSSPSPQRLAPYSLHRNPEPVYATAFHPSYNLQDAATAFYLASPRSLPIRLISPFSPSILASYSLVSPTTEDFIAPHSLLFSRNNLNTFFAGSLNLISIFDINRNGEGPAERMPTVPSKRSKAVGGLGGIKGIVSALDMGSEGILAAGTFSRWVGLYDAYGRGGSLGVFELPRRASRNGELGGTGVSQVLWSVDGRYLCVVQRCSNGIGVWDVRGTGKQLAWMRGRNAQTNQRMGVEVLGNELWAGGLDGIVRAHDDAVPSTTLHFSGSVFATCSGQQHFDASLNATNRKPGEACAAVPGRTNRVLADTQTRRVVIMALVYSIASLLRIGQQMKQPAVELRINPAALTENIFNRSTRSSSSEGMYHPIRQPMNPPVPTLLQKHAGFARFLKQHASPPHHRVTAGGRIVPAGPLSPPPFQLMPSINAVVANPQKFQTNLPGPKEANDPKIATGISARPLAQQSINVKGPKLFDSSQPASAIDNVGSASNSYIQGPLINQFGTNLGPLPPGATQIGFLPDGSPLVYYNGVNYQSYWDGNSTVLKPLQLSTTAISQMGYNTLTYPTMPFGPQYYGSYGSLGLSHFQDASGSLQFMDGINDAQDQPQQLNMAQSEDPLLLHHRLAAHLTSLDKHVALHLHEFSPAENARCTGMRRQLVEQLDSLRTSKKTNPIFDATNGAQAVLPTTPITSGHGSSQSYIGRLVPSPPKASKCLSPDAPPFVPADAKANLLDRLDIGQVVRGNNVQDFERHAKYRYNHDPAVLSVGRLHSHENKSDQDFNTVRTESRDGRSKSNTTTLSSSHELNAAEFLPLVSVSEIQYANVPGFSPSKGPKLYCTTASEFQEVIRRVREQAQMYGCKGGQSKDPAYDAEQDIRWAMADGEPIPLPKSPADHVAKPRPWSWDDSDFNHRRALAQPSDVRDTETDALSFDSQGIAYSVFGDEGSLADTKQKTAKVNLPSTQGYPTSSEPAPASKQTLTKDLPTIRFQKLPSDDTPEAFLRGMLRSPRYSAARIHQSEPFDQPPYKVRLDGYARQEPMKRLAGKENVRSDEHHFNKARSSLAASNYQATGRLPQYDGAGDAVASRDSQARLKDLQTSSRREQAQEYDVGPTDSYDYRGLTRKDFLVTPDGPSNRALHYRQVERFFDRLSEEELQEVAAAHGK
ncbi:MAG: hypothetical protein Q9182_000428 [Xanthomendoza sp. 2 TL-2023]